MTDIYQHILSSKRVNIHVGESIVLLWVFDLRVWVALRQYSNVYLRPTYINTVVMKGLKLKLISIFCG